MREQSFKETLISIPISESAFAKRNDTSITWLTGAGFMINCRGTIIFIDPVISVKPGEEHISEIGLALKLNLPILATQVPKVDYVLYTHSDIDHLGPQTAIELAKHNVQFIGTYPVYYQLTQLGINPKQVAVCRIGEQINIGDVVIEITPADHPWQLKDLARGGRPFRMGDCCGYILNTQDGRMFFPGDTRLMEEHLKIRDIDLLALDVSMCEYHLNHTSAAVLANNLPNAYLFPYHYGTYNTENPAHCGNPKDVYSKIKNGEQRGLILAPGEAFILRSFNV